MNTLEKPISLNHFKWASGRYSPDSAPIHSKNKTSKLESVALLSLKVGDIFFHQQWPVRYPGQYYFFRLVQKRTAGKKVYFDCAWLNEKRKLLAGKHGRALFSTISHFPLEKKTVYTKKKDKKRKAPVSPLSTTPHKVPKLVSAFKPIKAETKVKVEPKAEPVVKEEPTAKVQPKNKELKPKAKAKVEPKTVN